MRVLFLIFVIACNSILLQVKAQNKQNNEVVKAMTFNIRYASQHDGENIWQNRKELVYAVFKKYNCDFVGTQEVLAVQLKNLQENLPKYSHISRSRNVNPEKGEACPIFYVKKKWKLIDSQTFWFSTTPAIAGSKSWESSLPRICTWALFENHNTGFQIKIYNTHFDHISQKAREESVKLIIDSIQSQAKDSIPFILMGDLNVEPDNWVIGKLNSLYLDNYLSVDHRNSPDYTFQAWDLKSKKRIDYIFTAKNTIILKAEVIRDNNKGRFPSDHLPVYSKIQFQK